MSCFVCSRWQINVPKLMNCSNDFCRMLSWKQSLMERRPNTLCYRCCVVKDSFSNDGTRYQRCLHFISDHSRPFIGYGHWTSRPKVISPEVMSPEIRVMSPEIFCQVARNFVMLSNIVIALVSIHQILKNKICYSFDVLVSFHQG